MDRLDLSAISKNEEDRRSARVLSILIWASWGVYLVVIITGLYYKDWKTIAVTLAGSALLSVALVLLRRQHLNASGLVVMLIELGTVTFIATVGQGIRDLAIVSFPIILFFAGLALNRVFFRLCVGLALVAVCWLVFGEFYGWFVTQPFEGEMTNWFYLIGMISILLVAALAVDLLATNMRRNLERARVEVVQRQRIEQEILQLNAELEQRVEERTSELRQAQEQLVRQERLATLGQLAGSVSHELRNPLGVISNAIYYLKMSQPEASDKVKEYLEIIEKETLVSDKIISDLLDFTRIKSLDRQPVSVSELAAQTLERYPAPPPIQVAIEIPAGLPQVYADPQHVIQILVNLLTNACQAMNADRSLEQTKLTVSAAAQSDMICICIQDTGSGIPPENMGKLFQPLFTTKTKGIGLGLAVSQKLAEANGGRIEVESVVGKGSTFTVYLPVYRF